jgi:intergrase/recombinase
LEDGYIKDLVNTLRRFILEEMIELPEDISEMQCIALRSYLSYLQRLLLTDEGAKEIRKRVSLIQSKVDNYIPTNEKVIGAYSKVKDKRYKTIFKLLAFSGARITELMKMV